LFAGGNGSLLDTLGVAAWGIVPSVFQTSVGVVLFYFAVRNATLDGNVAVLAEQIRSLTATTTGGNVLLSALVTVWQ
jgi:hypothetical protein